MSEANASILPDWDIWLPFWNSLALPVSLSAVAVTQLDALLSRGGGRLPSKARLAASTGLSVSVLAWIKEFVSRESEPGKTVTIEHGRQTIVGAGTSTSSTRAKEVEVRWTSASMRGWRPTMEDEHLALSARTSAGNSIGIFGVFDGHGGWEVSAVTKRLMAKMLSQKLADVDSTADEPNASTPGRRMEDILAEAVSEVDDALLGGPLGIGYMLHKEWLHPFSGTGCTSCLAALDVSTSQLVVANTGDSRAILCSHGQILPLSEDHKPEQQVEFCRIVRAGGRVLRCGPCFRVDGGLNLSRALGDFRYKANPFLPSTEQKVIATPDVAVTRWDIRNGPPGDDFLIVACDGLFERMSREDVVDFVRTRLRKGWSSKDTLRALLRACCARSPMENGQDNETAILVQWNVE